MESNSSWVVLLNEPFSNGNYCKKPWDDSRNTSANLPNCCKITLFDILQRDALKPRYATQITKENAVRSICWCLNREHVS